MIDQADNTPHQWPIRRLDEVADINPSTSHAAPTSQVSFLPMNAVSEDGRVISAEVRTYSEVRHGYSAFSDGDILLAKITPCFENGKGALVTGLVNGIGFGSTEFHVLRPDPQLADPKFLELHTRLQSFRRRAEANMTGTAGQKRVPADFLASYRIPLPPLSTQRTIADFLSTWDHAIDQLDKLIDAKTRLRNAVAHQLLTGRVRFPEFVRSDKVRQTRFGPVPADWEVVPLRSVTTESTARAGSSFTTADIYAVTKTSGMVPMREQIKSRTADRYKIVQPDSFAYNPMRINVGSIARWSGQSEIVVSPDYVVFACDASRLLPAFLDALRHTARWRYFIDVAGSGSVRVRIYFGDLGSFPLALPSLQEQSAIVETLSGIDNEIQLLEAQKSNLGAQKRGLMQKLLTGQWTTGGNHGQG